MTRSIVLLALAGAAALAADTTTVSLLVPYVDKQAIASVVAADSVAATYALGCPPGNSQQECSFLSRQTLIQGPSTLAFGFTMTSGADSVTQSGNCKLNPKDDIASCTMAEIATVEGKSTSTSTVIATKYKDELIPVTITAGAEKLSALPGATATATVTHSASLSPTVSPTFGPGPDGGKGSASNSTSASTTTVARPTSTNAAGPMNTHNVILAGIAAIIGGAMIL